MPPTLHKCNFGCGEEFDKSYKLSRHLRKCPQALRTSVDHAARLDWLEEIVPEATARSQRIITLFDDDDDPIPPPSPAPVPVDSDNLMDLLIEPEFPTSDLIPEPPILAPPSPPKLTQSGRPRREYRLPKRFTQVLPEPPAPIPPPLEPEPPEPEPSLPRVRLIVRDTLKTKPNNFGVWRDYPRRPTHDPDSTLALEDLASTSISRDSRDSTNLNLPVPPEEERPAYWPFKNPTVHGIMSWLNNGVLLKSEQETTKLITSVFDNDTFERSHIEGFDAHRENIRLDKALEESPLDGFKESSVNIQIPSGVDNIPSTPFTVPNLHHRNLTSIIKDAFSGSLGHLHHYSPFKHMYTSPLTNEESRIYDEIYTSDAFLKANEDVQIRAKVPEEDRDCRREKVVAAMMFSSDATHLTNFGNAKAWPIYMMLGNVSKYIRSKPGSGAMHHVAYIPSLPDSFQDIAATVNQKWKSQKEKILTHCRRDLMHAVWDVILDEEFLHAYEFGIVVMCTDGIERRIYPRIFTYSADYPEKVLLATIRDKGIFPCIRCMVPKSSLDRLATRKDMKYRQKNREFQAERVELARILINDKGKGVGSVAVERLLKEFSAVPTMNSFVKKLRGQVDPSTMLVVDLMHEFELGVWKALFVHLIRVLYAAGKGSDELVVEFDRRFRTISTFGISTIRTFSNNTSEMKKLAARDYEDILQCAIPAFEGLLEDKANHQVMKLLYRMAEWHGLAKLRLHTDKSLNLFEEMTRELGDLLRKFRDFSQENYTTYELPREMEGRLRREKEKTVTASTVPSAGSAASTEVSAVQTPAARSSRKPRVLNLSTVKMHFLGDYPNHIRLFGTTDSYSTQLGELAHRLLKSFYTLTNKKNASKQMAKKYIRLELLRERTEDAEANNSRLDSPYYISHSRALPVNIRGFVVAEPRDPAKRLFLPTLQNHILGRLLGRQFDGDDMDEFTDNERNSIRFLGDRMYRHSTFRVNYTTYDMRRAYDTVNPRTRPFIMLASPEKEEGAHPFWYASVLGIFHAEVQQWGGDGMAGQVQEIQFLWVRWLGAEPGYKFGRKVARLPKIGFVPESDDYAFGFVDPGLVLRGCHLIPAFASGRTSELLSTREATEARFKGEVDDWTNYYVGIFVDRDMLARYLGIGIGHKGQTSHETDLEAGEGLIEEEEEEEAGRSAIDRYAEELEDSDTGEEEEEHEEEEEGEEEEGEFSDGDLGYDDL